MGRPRLDESKLNLSPVQIEFCDAYYEYDKSPTRIARALGWPDRGRVSSMLKSEKIQIEIARREGKAHLFKAGNDTFNISRSDRIKLLWSLAKTGTKDRYDSNGNLVMSSPAAAVAAIRSINEMMGDNAPTEVEVTMTVDNRTEAEIHENIQRLIIEANNLPALE